MLLLICHAIMLPLSLLCYYYAATNFKGIPVNQNVKFFQNVCNLFTNIENNFQYSQISCKFLKIKHEI